MLKDKLNKEKDSKKSNNKKCKPISEETCLINSQNKIVLNKWINKREDLNNNNIKDKLKECGNKDFKLIVLKKRDNNKNIEELCKIKTGTNKLLEAKTTAY